MGPVRIRNFRSHIHLLQNKIKLDVPTQYLQINYYSQIYNIVNIVRQNSVTYQVS